MDFTIQLQDKQSVLIKEEGGTDYIKKKDGEMDLAKSTPRVLKS